MQTENQIEKFDRKKKKEKQSGESPKSSEDELEDFLKKKSQT